MNIEEKDINKTSIQVPTNEAAKLSEEEKRTEAIDSLADDIIRNDTIPETSKDTPGSNGAFPVGAFDTSKDY
jgi:hypothetical protein